MYSEAQKEAHKKYYQAHREERLVYQKQYAMEHEAEIASRHKEYYQEHKGTVALYNTGRVQERQDINARWNEKHPKEYKAQQVLTYALKKGKLIKPRVCSNCNRGGKIEGHHEDYDKPLEIVWLCIRCHNDRHVEIRRRYDRKST